MNPHTNQTTIKQGFRLLEAGCPDITLHMQPSIHKVVPDSISLGRLWDMAHSLGLACDFSLELTSNELTEAIVTALENYYRNEAE